MVAAEAGGMAVATCDRAGPERGARWAGATGIAGPDGALLAAAPTPDATLVLADVELTDDGPPFRSTRRPDLYGPLLEP
jgi:predicted amidohydrolase